jgi:simple sugar transport system ATP-binding protein
MSTAIHLKDITKRFPGGVLANDDIDLAVEHGSVHALLGENGAGKTTLMNVLYGLYEPTAGTVHIEGEPVEFDTPQDAIERGVGMIHQHFMLVDPMTVLENIALGWEPVKYGGVSVDDGAVAADIRELSERYNFGVADDIDTPVEQLSVGQQQRVEILKTLYRGADFFIFDEPTSVLTPQEASQLFEVFDELTKQGKTIIFITHKLNEALTAADEITVLRDGRTVGTVDSDGATKQELARQMVGRDVLLSVDKAPADPGGVQLSVSDLSVDDEQGVRAVDGVDLRVRQGEIFGIAGVDGNGQSELVGAITGLCEPATGTVTYQGDDITGWSRQKRIAKGMSYIPGERQERALVLAFDLIRNAALGNQHSDRFRDGRQLDWDTIREHAKEIIDTYDVRPPDPTATAGSLSGGNQQKFVVGREFLRDPDLVVAAHPTRGVDVGSMEFIHEQILQMRDRGVATVLVSASLDEVLNLSDRIGVLYDGSFVDVVDPESVTREEMGLLMAGQQRQEPVAQQ